MRTRAALLTMLLTAALATGCGSDDPEPDGAAYEATGAPAAMAEAAEQLDLACEFEPEERESAIGAGTATLTGTNTSDVRIDSLAVTLSLDGSAGAVEADTFVVYFMPGEELAQWVPVLAEYDGELTGDCTVAEVRGSHYGGQPEIEPEASACEVSGEPGDWELRADLSNVQGVPFETDKFVGVVTERDGKRTAIHEDELSPGEMELAFSSTLQEEPTCTVRYVRDL